MCVCVCVEIKAIWDLVATDCWKTVAEPPRLLPQHILESCRVTMPIFLFFSFHPSPHSHLPPFAHFTFTPAPSFPGESPNEPNYSVYNTLLVPFLFSSSCSSRMADFWSLGWGLGVRELWDFLRFKRDVAAARREEGNLSSLSTVNHSGIERIRTIVNPSKAAATVSGNYSSLLLWSVWSL